MIFYEKEDLLQNVDDDDPWVLYLIVRESLNMTPGKLAAQIGHAVSMVEREFRKLFIESICSDFGCEYLLTEVQEQLIKDFENWEKSSHRKVTLGADEKEWEKLKKEHDCFVVVDAGLTQVDPGSETVIALWPIKRSQRSKILKRLRALK